jgi:hypothetical protein
MIVVIALMAACYPAIKAGLEATIRVARGTIS